MRLSSPLDAIGKKNNKTHDNTVVDSIELMYTPIAKIIRIRVNVTENDNNLHFFNCFLALLNFAVLFRIFGPFL